MNEAANLKWRILLVDDHTVVRQGTREMLARRPEFEMVGELASAEQLEGMIRLKKPHLLLLDINLPGKTGLEALQELRPKFPELKILMFSAFAETPYLIRAMSLGADGYISKTVTEDQLCNSLLQVFQNGKGPVFSSDMQEKWEANQSAVSSVSHGKEGEVNITPREHEILILVAQGLTNRDISRQLNVSVKTVDTHVANIMKKLSLNNRTQLTAYAYRQGLV